jgi:fibronectin-binding autotransporter adhesin
VDVVQGGLEFLKDQLIPAVWWGDNNGDWSTLTNWNSGQPVVTPPVMSGQLAPLSTVMPTPRLPGAAGSGPTAGSNDTVILERPTANITVTLSTGSHNVRKLYQRETLNITGGSLNINYVPVAESTLFSARLQGATSISGNASLSGHTIWVDPAITFTAGASNLTFNTIQLQRGATPGKLLINGNVSIAGLSGATATIGTNIGVQTTGVIDLAGGTRIITVADGAAATDLDVLVPITNGTLTKSGTGNMKLNVGNGLSGVTTINDGILDVTGASQLGSSVVTNITVTTSGSAGAGHGGTLRLNNGVSYNLPMTINGGGLNGVSGTAPGIVGALDSGGGTNTWAGNIVLAGTGVNGTDPTINQVSAATGATLVLSGVISDPADLGALAKSGDGDVVLTGASANTYGERTRVYGGRLIIEKDGALGSAGSSSGATGNTFQLGPSNSTIAFRAPGASPGINYSTDEWINLDGSGNGSLGQLDNLGGANTFAGQIGLSGTVDAKIGVSAGSLMLTGGVYTRGTDGSRVINKIGAGTLIIAGNSGAAPSNSLNGSLVSSTVNVNAGNVQMRAPSDTTTNLPGVTTWNVNTGASLVVESGLFSTNTLNVAGGNVVITPTGSGKTIHVNALNITGGTVDLGKSKLIVDHSGSSPLGSWGGSAYTGLIGKVQSGFDSGTWGGQGIRTSEASGLLTTIAIAEAADVLGLDAAETTTWRGQVVDGTSVLAAYTWGGDADLNGELNGDDYFFIDSHVLQSGSQFGYNNGDFDYNGEINGDDYFIIDSNIQYAQAGPPIGASSLTAVPEPGVIGVMGLGLLGLRRRRSK